LLINLIQAGADPEMNNYFAFLNFDR